MKEINDLIEVEHELIEGNEEETISENPPTESSKKQNNLEIISNALNQEFIKEFSNRTLLYDTKFKEVFENLTEIQDLLLLSLEEGKRSSLNLTQLEIDAKIAKAFEEFGFKEEQQDNKNNNLIYFFILFVLVILLLGKSFINHF